jgi:hypothetical protein
MGSSVVCQQKIICYHICDSEEISEGSNPEENREKVDFPSLEMITTSWSSFAAVPHQVF